MSRPRTIAPAEAATFLGTAAVLVAYAQDRGAYDLVIRQQASLVVWITLLLVAALGLLPARRPAIPVAAALLALAALALWSAASLSWTQSDERTLAEVARTLHHLGLLALVVALAGEGRWIAVTGGASAGAVLICLWSLGIRLAPGTFGEDATALAFATNRLSSPLAYWNATGAWAAMTAPLLLAWSAHARTPAVRALALAALPAALLVLYLTLSRGAVVSVVVATAVVLAFSAHRWMTALHALAAAGLGVVVIFVTRDQPEIAQMTGTAGRADVAAALALCTLGAALVALATTTAGLDRLRMDARKATRCLRFGGALATVLLIVAAGTVIPDAWDDFRSAPLTQQTSTDPASRLTTLHSGRYEIYRSAAASLRDRPLKGSGAGTFEFTWNRDGRTPEFVRDAHSLYLEPFSELGLPGGLLILLFAAAIVAGVIAAARAVRGDPRASGAIAGCAGGCAAYLVAAGVDWMWEVTAVTAFFLLLAGAAGAATLRDAGPPRLQTRIAIAAAALVAVLVTLPGLRSETALRDSQREVRRGDLVAAARFAREAESSAPWAAGPHVQLALIHERAGLLDDARAELLAARRREPSNWRIPFLLSRVEVARGDVGSALRALRSARTLRPLGAFVTDPAATATPPER